MFKGSTLWLGSQGGVLRMRYASTCTYLNILGFIESEVLSDHVYLITLAHGCINSTANISPLGY